MRCPERRILLIAVAAALLAPSLPAHAQDWESVTIETTPVGDGIWMLEGRGGNLGLAVGEKGAFLIDDQYAPLTDKILAAVHGITDQPVRFVLNTHWHGDHVGGNENMGRAGAVLVAHENVRERMSADQFSAAFQDTVPASPDAALPVVTFTHEVGFHLGEHPIRVFHVESAHTDGDAIVHFPDANVIHMGDVFFNGLYPYVDVSAGGSVYGILEAVERVLPLIDGNTAVIPGHGALSNREGLLFYRDMLATIVARMEAGIREGKTLEEVQASRPTEEWDPEWGELFLGPDKFVEILYSDLAGR